MNEFFADTFFWIALTDTQDEGHERADAFARSTTVRELVTTEEVLIEYLNYFAGSRIRGRATLIVHDILIDPEVRVLPQATSTFQDGLDLYRRRPDKGYSLTDCISMVAMRREGLADVLTNDAHFEQEGFRAVFRERR